MVKIVSVEKLRSASRVCFDDGASIILRNKDAEGFKLSVGAEIERDALIQRLCAAQFDDAYEAALNILDRSAKTEAEIHKKLVFKGYLDQVADAVCLRLKETRLIDDKYIAQRLSSGMSAAGKGKYAVLQKLRARGIDKADSEEVMDEITDDMQNEAAFCQASKIWRKYAALDKRERKSKLSQALARRGFSWDSIEYAIERLEEDRS